MRGELSDLREDKRGSPPLMIPAGMEKNYSGITVYTDGSSIRNNGYKSSCGWACILQYGGISVLKSGGRKGKTSNQMEVIAVLEALRSITDRSLPVTVYTDSRYVVQILNDGHAVRANKNLWEEVMTEVGKFPDIRFVWIKGHDGNPYNEEVDRAARKEAFRQRGKLTAWKKRRKKEKCN